MEIRRNEKDQILVHGDTRLPEIVDAELKGPSRARVLVNLAGMGFGFLMLLIGLGMGLSRGLWDKPALIPVIAGGALVASWVTVNHRFLIMLVRNRRVMVGTNAVFMGLLALTLLTAANFVAYRHYRKWDLTVEGRFTLSPKTQKVLGDLKKNITIITFTLARTRTGQEEAAARLKELLKLYTETARTLDVKFVQADIDPSARMLGQKYNISLSSLDDFDTVYVICGAKRKVVHLREIMDYMRDPENPYGAPKPTAFKGEQYMTSAIVEVTQPRQPKVYFVSGHGEREIDDATAGGLMEFANSLKRDNIAAETLLGIPSTGVPADCDALVIMAPQAEYAGGDVERVSQYLNRGGRVLVAVDVGRNSGLESLLTQWGIKFDNDAVISLDAETADGNPVIFEARDFGDHEIAKPLKGYSVQFNFARSVSALPDSTGRLELTVLIKSTKGSYGETDVATLFKTGQSTKDPRADIMGPLGLAIACEERSGGEGGKPANKAARIVAFGDADAFSTIMLTRRNENADLVRNSMNWLLNRQELIAIDARPETRHAMAADQAAIKAVLLYVVIGIPCLVLLMGGVVWALRSYGSKPTKQ